MRHVEIEYYTNSSYFKPLCLNVFYQFTPLLDLRSLIFDLTPFGWLRSITLTSNFLWIIYLICVYLI